MPRNCEHTERVADQIGNSDRLVSSHETKLSTKIRTAPNIRR